MDDYHSSVWLSEEESNTDHDSNSEEAGNSDRISDFEIELYSRCNWSSDINSSLLVSTSFQDSCSKDTNISFLSKSTKICRTSADIDVSIGHNSVNVNDMVCDTPQVIHGSSFLNSSNLEEHLEHSENRKLNRIDLKRKKRKRREKNTEESCKRKSVKYNMSDSDKSVICIESDDDNTGDMLSNICHGQLKKHTGKSTKRTNCFTESNLVCVDSSSISSNSPFHEKITIVDTPKSFSKLSVINSPTPVSEMPQNGSQWQVNHDDLYSHIKPQSRYHGKQNSMCCGNCKKQGHTAKFCQEAKQVKCFICGGDHPWIRCKSQICGKCYQDGHIARHCRYRSNEIRCGLCQMKGHIDRGCPDLWRRYHLTTSPDVIIKGDRCAERSAKYCYNCGRKGHFGHECPKPRMSLDSYPTWPFVVSYKDPKKILQRHYSSTAWQRGEREKRNSRGRSHSLHVECDRRSSWVYHSKGEYSEVSPRLLKRGQHPAFDNHLYNNFCDSNNIYSREPYFPRRPTSRGLDDSERNISVLDNHLSNNFGLLNGGNVFGVEPHLPRTPISKCRDFSGRKLKKKKDITNQKKKRQSTQIKEQAKF